MVSHDFVSPKQQQALITKLLSNRNSERIAVEFDIKRSRHMKDAGIIGRSGNPFDGLNRLKDNDPKMLGVEIWSQLKDLPVNIGNVYLDVNEVGKVIWSQAAKQMSMPNNGASSPETRASNTGTRRDGVDLRPGEIVDLPDGSKRFMTRNTDSHGLGHSELTGLRLTLSSLFVPMVLHLKVR